MAEWARQALRAARRREASSDLDRGLEVVRVRARHTSPSADIAQMLEEIEKGYRLEEPS